MQLLSSFLTTLFAGFVVVDPIPVAPMFAAMTAGRPSRRYAAPPDRLGMTGRADQLLLHDFDGHL
jgi:hypothetical protein